MQIKCKLILSLLNAEILEFEVDENMLLKDFSLWLSKQQDMNLILLPLLNKLKWNNESTIRQYIDLAQATDLKIYFTLVNSDMLSEFELDILSTVAIPSTEKPSLDFSRIIPLLSQTLPREIIEAFLVRFGDGIVTMYGLTAWDDITNSNGRQTLQLHPYSWVRAGASAVIIHKDKRGIPYVLLVYNQRGDKRPLNDPQRRAGIPSDWKVPEGHLNAKPCKSTDSTRNGIIRVTDESEELLLSGECMNKAYDTTPHSLFSTGESMVEGVLREVKEEVGLSYLPLQARFVHQLDHYQRPMITDIYVINAGTKNELPRFKVDGIEIVDAMWAKLHAFQFKVVRQQLSVMVNYYDVEGNEHPVKVTTGYAILIGRAIQKFREDEVQEASALFGSRKNVEAKIERILKSIKLNPDQKTCLDVLGPTPESLLSFNIIPGYNQLEKEEHLMALSSLGKFAFEYHKKILALAKLFNRTPEEQHLTAQQLINISTIGVEIEDNLSGRPSALSLFRLNANNSMHMTQHNEINLRN